MSALVWHEIRGRSMWPLTAPLRAGVRQVAATALQPGDIIAFLAERAPELWIHRVVRVEAAAIVTRGDTNAFADQPVPFSAVLGRVEAVQIGPLAVPLAQSGLPARLQRQLGMAWSRVAPGLRRRYARQDSPRKPV